MAIFSRKRLVIGGAIVLGIIAVVFFIKPRTASPYELTSVTRGDIFKEINVTGAIKPFARADLTFDVGGRVSRIYTEIGDRVQAGQRLIELESAELGAQLEEARANARGAEARLAALRRGSRPEEIKVAEAKAESILRAVDDAREGVVDALGNAFTQADDAVRIKADQLFSNGRSVSPVINANEVTGGSRMYLEFQRFLAEGILVSWRSELDRISSGETDLTDYIAHSKINVQKIQSFIDALALAHLAGRWSADLRAARTNLVSAAERLTSTAEKWHNAKNQLAVAREELALTRSGTAVEEITAQKAEFDQAQARVSNILAALEKRVLRAPFDGLVTSIVPVVGETVSVGAPAAAIIDERAFTIETFVPEADIAAIKVGNQARVTLDAYGNDVSFPASIRTIEPAETIIDGVVTYKTILELTNADPRIRSGLTASVNVSAERHTGVLTVPERVLIRKDGKFFVRVPRDKESSENALAQTNNDSSRILVEVEVIIGLRGSNGAVEILSGLTEGERVVVVTEPSK